MMRTFVTIASQVIAANIDIEIKPRSSNVVAAFFDFGLRNAGTPLAIASIPSTQWYRTKCPREKEHESAPVAVVSASMVHVALSACGTVPFDICQIPRPPSQKIPMMKPYVGMADAVPGFADASQIHHCHQHDERPQQSQPACQPAGTPGDVCDSRRDRYRHRHPVVDHQALATNPALPEVGGHHLVSPPPLG